MRIAAIDQGTTSTRVLVTDAQEQTSLPTSVEHQQHYPHQGWVEHDPEELINNILTCVAAAGNVDVLGISNQGESCLAWDAVTKQALSPIIVWQDNRTEETIQKLKADGCESTTLERAGLPLDSYFSASKLAWILQQLPAAKQAHLSGTLRLGTTDAFFLDRLTGRCVSDISTASRTSLMNLKTGQWDETLCELFGVPIETLPQIVSSTGDFGVFKSSHGSTPIVASIVDQQAALYGFGCRTSGDVKFTFGTGAFALTLTGNTIYRRPEQGLLPTVAWQKSGESPQYALDGGIYTASAALNWAKSLGLFTDTAEINHFDGPSAIERGLAFIPALSGLACPHWDRQARGAWLGMTVNSNRTDLVQAIIEGIAFRAGEVIDAMSRCISLPGAIGIDGGMSKNPYFVQFLADVLERELRPAQLPELTAWGVATLAADAVSLPVSAPLEFGSVLPQQNRSADIQRFEQAIHLSRQWLNVAPSP